MSEKSICYVSIPYFSSPPWHRKYDKLRKQSREIVGRKSKHRKYFKSILLYSYVCITKCRHRRSQFALANTYCCCWVCLIGQSSSICMPIIDAVGRHIQNKKERGEKHITKFERLQSNRRKNARWRIRQYLFQQQQLSESSTKRREILTLQNDKSSCKRGDAWKKFKWMNQKPFVMQSSFSHCIRRDDAFA